MEEDPARALRAEPRTWTPIKIVVAAGLVLGSLGFGPVLIHSFVVSAPTTTTTTSSSTYTSTMTTTSTPPEICQDLPYSPVPVPAITVGPAEAVADWENCPMSAARYQTGLGLGAGMSPPSPQRRLSGGTCRRYRVPLDYSQGLAGGTIIVTVKRDGPATKSDGQLWIMQGGPGVPSHPMLGLLAGLGKVSYALDHRGTGWSTVLDCPKVRSKQPGKLPWGNSWMKGVGFGNVSTETVDACLAEISGDIGAPKHFTAANAARDLASVIMAIQAETGSTADVGIHGLSYGTLWARRFLELQGQEFPVIVSHVGIDGVCGGDYDFGQFALAANRAGQRLLDEYCDAGCRGELGAPATGSVGRL